MSELHVKFGGKLWTVLDPKSGVRVDANAFGDAVLTATDDAKFAGFLNSVGGEVGGNDLTKTTLLEHASVVLQKRTAELGVMKAIEARGFAEALTLSANTRFSSLGAEVKLGELTVNLSPESSAALQADAQQHAMAKVAALTAPPASSPPTSPTPSTGSKSPAAVVGAIALTVLAAIGSYVVKSLKHGGTSGGLSDWDGTRPYRCGGHDDVVFGGVTASLPGQIAIIANDHCHLRLDDVHLVAATGIKATGNAVVELNGGSVDGTELAATSLGNARVTFKNTKVKGETSTGGNGSISGP